MSVTTYETPRLKGKETYCEKHGKSYLKIFVKGVKAWVGSCPDCSADAELERRAIAKLPSHEAEIRARVAKKLKHEESEIKKQVEAELDAYISEIRPEFEADVASRWAEAVRGEVEAELVREVIAKIKSEETKL